MSQYCVPNYFYNKGKYSYISDFIRQYVIAKYRHIFNKPNHSRYEILENEVNLVLYNLGEGALTEDGALTKDGENEKIAIINYYDKNNVFHMPENGGIFNGFFTGNRRELKNFIDCLRPPQNSKSPTEQALNVLPQSEDVTPHVTQKTENDGGRPRRRTQARKPQVKRTQRKKTKTFKPRRRTLRRRQH
jgi:hypothetical protein